MKRIVFALLLVCTPLQQVFGDGGALILQQRVGALNVSVFASPTPLRAGQADLSVLLQDAENDGVLLDGTVELELTKTGEPGIKANATTGQASNKLLYAAAVQIPEPGDWNLTVRCREGGTEAVVRGNLSVFAAEAPVVNYWPYFAIVPLAVSLFALNQRLKSRRRVARRPTRP